MKGRTCADGRKQRKWKSKEESASPNAHANSTLLTSIVGVHENRPVVVADTKGAHSNAEFDEFLLTKFGNEQVGVTCGMDRKYRKHVATEDSKRFLCLVLSKASCGCA